MPETFASVSAADASGTSCGRGCAAIAAVASGEASGGLAAAVIAARLGLRSGNGTTTAGFATLVAGLAVFAVLTLFAATGLTRAFVACVFAASGPGARSSGTSNAQNTKSDTVAFVRVILVDRSGFAIPP
jgi:hypothetical protein